MKRFIVVLVAVALAGAGVATTSGRPSDDEVPIVTSGPALGGDRVFWGEATPDTMFVLLRSPGAGPKVVYRRGSTPSRQDWSAGSIAASRSIVAFHRVWIDCSVPHKEPPRDGHSHGRFQVSKGLLPHELRTEEIGVCGGGGADARVGGHRGPFKPLSRKRYCPDESGIGFDVEGDVIAFAETFCRRGATRERVAVRQFGRGRETQLENVPARTDCCGGVRIAGRFVAWREGQAVVVYDRSLGRSAYRARVPRTAWIDFDVQQDGKLIVAIAGRYVADRPIPASLVWFSPQQRTGRLFSNRALFTGVRLVDDQALFEQALGSKDSELVLLDIAGRGRRVALFRKGNRRWADFDFDGHAVAWASRQDTTIRRSCGRSCRYVADGVITIWKAEIRSCGVRPARVAERPFRGLRPAT